MSNDAGVWLMISLVTGIPVLVVGGLAAFWNWQDWATNRRYAEQRRVSEGWPPHQRCLCASCASWRAVPANITRLAS